MKKIILTILLFSFFYAIPVKAANTHSADLEAGSSQYFSASDSASLDITGDLTFEGWFKFESLPSVTGYMQVVSKGYTSPAYVWRFEQSPANVIVFYYFDGSSNLTQSFSDSAVVTAGELGTWIHFAVTVAVATKDIKMYKNGVQIADTNSFSNAASIRTNNEGLGLGCDTGVTYPFDGLMDDVRIWSDVRTATEIYQNRFQELTGSEINLVGYWKLNNGLLDETSNNNDLTNNNSAVFVTDFFPPTSDWQYVQLFNGLTTADLNGQDSWSGSADYDVLTTSPYEGAKAIGINPTAGAWRTISRTINSMTSGTMYFAVKPDNVNDHGTRLNEGANARMGIWFGYSGWNDNDILIYDNGAANWVDVGDFNAGQWYLMNVEFDDNVQANKYRMRWHDGTSWSTWTSWYTVEGGSYSTIDTMVFYSYRRGDSTNYWDTVTSTNPIAEAAPAVPPKKKFNMIIFE